MLIATCSNFLQIRTCRSVDYDALQKWEDIVSIHEVKGGMSTTALKKCLAEGSIVETAHHAQWLFDDAIRQRVHDAYMTHVSSLYSKENNYGRDIPHTIVVKKSR